MDKVKVDVQEVPVLLGATLECIECGVEWPWTEAERYARVLRRTNTVQDGILYCPACMGVLTMGNV